MGYCEMGSMSIETMPMTTVKMAMTIATIGRRMKNFDMNYLPDGGSGADAAACVCEV